METIEGRVLTLRDLGGILFIKILTDNQKIELVCRKDMVKAESLSEIKRIRNNDFCCFQIIKDEEERIITDLVSKIGKIYDNSWTEDEVDIVRAYAYVVGKIREYLTNHGFLEVRLPSIHYGEQKQDAFHFEFFNQPARLTSSNAMFLNAYAVQIAKVFTIQKCFRAEPSHTNRHLAEFDMLEVAILNKDLPECMTELEKMIKYVVDHLNQCPFKGMLHIDAEAILNNDFPIVEYKDVAEQYEIDGAGLGKYERIIAKEEPVFVKHYPQGVASWMAKPYDAKYTLSFNLLVPDVGELVEGNEKQTDISLLRQKIKRAGMAKQLGWYPEMMPYSGFKLSGFGMGIERLVMWLLGLKNIRSVHQFYRDKGFSEISTLDDGV